MSCQHLLWTCMLLSTKLFSQQILSTHATVACGYGLKTLALMDGNIGSSCEYKCQVSLMLATCVPPGSFCDWKKMFFSIYLLFFSSLCFSCFCFSFSLPFLTFFSFFFPPFFSLSSPFPFLVFFSSFSLLSFAFCSFCQFFHVHRFFCLRPLFNC